MSPPAVLAMGDFGDPRCGVGASMAATVAGAASPVDVLDPTELGWLAFWRAARRLARTGATCVAVYPTRSTVYRRSLPLRFVLLWGAFGRSRLRLHLHEHRNLRRLLRWPVSTLVPLARRVVVSSAGEQGSVASAWWGRAGRWSEVLVAPPANGTPGPATLPARRRPPSGTVGVFGMGRDDKPVAWLEQALVALDPSFRRLELAGAGWEGQAWPASVLDRFDVDVLGHVDAGRLAGLFDGWDLALAPFAWPAHDGRMSLRTPLAHGVPTVSVGPPGADLTLRPQHLVLVPPAPFPDAAARALGADAAAGAAEVAAFEAEAVDRLRRALFGAAGRP